jgi:tetratricopeptide (TPR) repeat protein
MSNQIDYSGLIEKYLTKKMKQDELEWFIEEMEANPSLAEEVQMQEDIGKAILNEETLAFRAQIGNLFEKTENRKPVKSRKCKSITIPVPVRVAVASLAAFIMMGSGIYMYNNRTIPPDRLFEIYYTPYEGLTNVRSSSSQMTDILTTAMHKYENREFESALLLFETVLNSDSENITSRFYSGISYMETERYNVAQSTFTGIINHDDNLFIEHAEWYLGLCYLKIGHDVQARKLFTTIADGNGYYSSNARRLMRNLE